MCRALERVDCLWLEEGKELQIRDDLVICCVEPELEHLVRRRSVAVQPYRAALRLTELAAIQFRDQRERHAVGTLPSHSPDELDPGCDVAPLIAPAELQRALVPVEEGHEVIGLQHLVAELGI